MFNRKKRIMEMTSNYVPTSKSSLKSFCVMLAKGDVKQASELYDFYIEGMEDLPMFDPVPPTFMDNAKSAVTGVLDFVRDNKDGIGQVYDIFRGVMAARGKNLPSIGGEAVDAVAKELPNIN